MLNVGHLMVLCQFANLDKERTRKNTELFAARIKNTVLAISEQIAKDLTPTERREVPAEKSSPKPRQKPEVPAADDPL